MRKVSVVLIVSLLVSIVVYGAGWTDDGPVVRLTTSSDKVGIGTPSPSTKLHVHETTGNCILEITTDDETYSNIYFGTDINGSIEWGHIGLCHNGGNKLLKIAATGNIVNSNHLNITENGNIGIGTTNSGSYKLAVNGTIRAKEIKVETGWSDFVFEDNYKLMPLDKLEQHIKINKSLPGIPKEKEVAEEGVALGEMQAKLLEKVEELSLYVINQNKELRELKKENEELKERISILEKQ
jgi:hypothetical protein